MNFASYNVFECQMYVSPRGNIFASLPVENGPQKVARLVPLAHDKLIDPNFRRLLAAFDSVSSYAPQTVQV